MFRRSLLSYCYAAAIAEHYGVNVSVSPRAWRRIAEKNDEEGFANNARFLRLAIDSGGCHGYLYKFSFDPMDTLDAEEDVLIKETDVLATPPAPSSSTASATTGLDAAPPQVVIDRISIGKLEEAVLDYHSELKGSAFVVVGNSLVDQSCACALSFSMKKTKKPAGGGGGDVAAAATGGAADEAFLKGSSRSAGKPIQRGK